MTATLPREMMAAVFFPEKEDKSTGSGLLVPFDPYREICR